MLKSSVQQGVGVKEDLERRAVASRIMSTLSRIVETGLFSNVKTNSIYLKIIHTCQ